MSGPHVNHDEHDVYVYETSEIAEGNARVPLWLLASIVTLFAFFAYFIVTYWNAQPSSAQAARAPQATPATLTSST